MKNKFLLSTAISIGLLVGCYNSDSDNRRVEMQKAAEEAQKRQEEYIRQLEDKINESRTDKNKQE